MKISQTFKEDHETSYDIKFIFIGSTKTLTNENEQAKSLAVYTTKHLTMSTKQKKNISSGFPSLIRQILLITFV